MKIAIAQIESLLGDITGNYQKHIQFIEKSILLGADAIFFPELSLVGYDTRISPQLAMDGSESILASFQMIADNNHLTIGVGIPLKSNSGVKISMAIFQPQVPFKFYSKQILDPSETQSFINGDESMIIQVNEYKLAPAICFESTQEEHANKAFVLEPNLYLSTSINSEKGIQEVLEYFPLLAKKYTVPVILVNSIGIFNQSVSVGLSTIWNEKGEVIGQLSRGVEGILLYDTENQLVNVVEEK